MQTNEANIILVRCVLNGRFGIVLACEKHLHDHINVIREEVRPNKTTLAPPLCIDVPVQSHETARSCIYVIDVASL